MTRRFPGQEPGRVDSAPDEPIAVVSAMAEFERFARQAEDDRMLARRVTSADGVKADLVAWSLTDLALAAVDEMADPRGPGGDLGQSKRCAAGRVLLHPVVPLDDLDIGGLT